MSSLLVLNGPNLNLLGVREPEIYGTDTLESIEVCLREKAAVHGFRVEFLQSNAEHVLVESIHEAYRRQIDWVIINPGAFTHTSVAIRDAFLSTKLPFIEVHLSNVHAREPFRKHSYLSDVARGIIVGFGAKGYELAFDAATAIINQEQGL